MPRKNINWPEHIESRANEIINARGFSGLSDLLQGLVREEYERRYPPHVAGRAGAVRERPNSLPADEAAASAARAVAEADRLRAQSSQTSQVGEPTSYRMKRRQGVSRESKPQHPRSGGKD